MGTLALPSSPRAQAAWPTGLVTFVVGYAPGGSNDINVLAHADQQQTMKWGSGV
jgi:tripartite-type tricarboxylate transporter receptor subunit TctC